MSNEPRVVIKLDPNFAENLAEGLLPKLKQLRDDILADCQRLCPVDTGKLRESITVELDEDSGTIVGSSDVRYAGYVELGTSKMAAQPYMAPAFYQNRGTL